MHLLGQKFANFDGSRFGKFRNYYVGNYSKGYSGNHITMAGIIWLSTKPTECKDSEK